VVVSAAGRKSMTKCIFFDHESGKWNFFSKCRVIYSEKEDVADDIVTWMVQQEVGGRVNSVDLRGDVTYPHSFHQYTTLSKHSLPRGDVTRDNAMVTTQQ
jgi:hypothetical protein